MSNSAHIFTEKHFTPITPYYPTVTFQFSLLYPDVI